MTIDIERLKTDLDYWNSVAPEGATHYAQEETDYHEGWYKKAQDDIYFVPCGATAFNRKDVGSFSQRSCIIPRPSPTWNGEGLPPVGVECEGDTDCRPDGYEPCIPIWHSETVEWGMHTSVALFRDRHGQFNNPEWCTDFRPLRTEKERVLEAAAQVAGYGKDATIAPIVIGRLYDAGCLKMPGGE